MLIVIEGIDGSGKTTISKALAARIEARWMEFPDRSTVTGRAIDLWLRRELGLGGTATDRHFSAVVLQALFAVNRYEKFRELSAALCSTHLVSSRYVPSGVVYGELGGADRRWLEQIHCMLPEPDLSILLDVAPHVGLKRKAGGAEIFETLPQQERVRQLYLDYWERRRAAGNGRYVVVDASEPFDAVLGACCHWFEARRRNGMRG